jgi:hypothetical protein
VSASISTIPVVHASKIIQINISALSAENQSTAHSHASVSEVTCEDDFLIWMPQAPTSCEISPHHIYFNSLQHQPSSHDSDSDYSCINTPYSADGFNNILACTNLVHQYPELTWKLRNSFPISNLEPLSSTYTPNNLPGADLFKAICDKYVTDELSKKCFLGPYTHEELFQKIGHFCSSPLQVIVKAGINGKPDKHRVCCNLSY